VKGAHLAQQEPEDSKVDQDLQERLDNPEKMEKLDFQDNLE